MQAIAIPLAVLVMAVTDRRDDPCVRRRVRVHSAIRPSPPSPPRSFGLIVLVDAVIISTAASLAAARVPLSRHHRRPPPELP